MLEETNLRAENFQLVNSVTPKSLEPPLRFFPTAIIVLWFTHTTMIALVTTGNLDGRVGSGELQS